MIHCVYLFLRICVFSNEWIHINSIASDASNTFLIGREKRHEKIVRVCVQAFQHKSFVSVFVVKPSNYFKIESQYTFDLKTHSCRFHFLNFQIWSVFFSRRPNYVSTKYSRFNRSKTSTEQNIPRLVMKWRNWKVFFKCCSIALC